MGIDGPACRVFSADRLSARIPFGRYYSGPTEFPQLARPRRPGRGLWDLSRVPHEPKST